MTTPTILHILSQRPSLTGSGVTLDAMVSEADRAGWSQHVVVGTPARDPRPQVGPLDPDRIHPLLFDRPPLDFPVAGMSDVMPYRSTRFSSMSPDQLQRYRRAWREHLEAVIENTRPALIHCHHLWIVSSLLNEVAPSIPVVAHCHATGLRQMELCPHLADEIQRGCARNSHFLALRTGHAEAIREKLGVTSDRIEVVGAGYRDDLFHTRGRKLQGERIVYAGKFSASKGVPWLLDAFEKVRATRSQLELHIAGSGSGLEADAIARRISEMEGVVVHGRLDQAALSDLLRTAQVFVLPSFYEGVPLVLAEAAACGCRIVATELPGVIEELAPALGTALRTVELPRLTSVDRPDEADLPAFIDNLSAALDASLAEPQAPAPSELASRFSWSAVYRRVERVWRDLLAPG